MDLLSIVGLLIGLAAIVGGNLLEGGHASSLVQLTAFVIVGGGTLGAVMLQTPVPVFLHALKIFPWVFRPPPLEAEAVIAKVVGWSNVARKEGLLGLEGAAESEPDLFARKGLQLLVDGNEPEAIRSVMEVELETLEAREIAAARVFESMGGYSPTIGIIGAVMGLIHVMQNLADPSKLGPGIATAFVATIYGVGFANLLFLPVANKLKAIARRRGRGREMVLDGIVAIAEGENPRNIEARLQGFLE